MKFLLGPKDSGKTTLSFHYLYSQLSLLLPFDSPDAPTTAPLTDLPEALFLCSKKRLLSNQFQFGTYCEVSIETLKQVKLKYLEDYDSLVHFLTDAHLLAKKPALIALDGLEWYVESGGAGQISQLTKEMRVNFILSLLQ